MWLGKRGSCLRGSKARCAISLVFLLDWNRKRNTYPALISNAVRARTSETDTNDVSSGIEETLGQADELLVAHLLSKMVNSHGVDQLAIANSGAISKANSLLLSIDLGHLSMLAEALLLLGDGICDSDPDAASAVPSRESECSIGSPAAGYLIQDDVLGNCLDIRGSDSLAKPFALHL